MVKRPSTLTLLTAAAVLSLGLSSGSVLAQGGEPETSSPSPSTSVDTRHSGESSVTSSRSPEVESEADKSGEKNREVKRDKCAKKVEKIKATMARIETRAANQVKVFDAISARTQAFYKEKGKTVAGYDSLVAATVSAKAKVATDLAALKASDNFTCDSANPKATVVAFKAKVKVVVADLKAYRTSIKNLIVAVKSVQSTVEPKTSESPEASPSVKPSTLKGAN